MKDLMEKYFDRLWPLNRSLTGNGNRESLKILSEIVTGMNIFEVPSGTECFDWSIPPEWNVKEARIKDSKGNIVVDFENNNLHLLGYSENYSGKMKLADLKKHLYTLPEQPDLIPYHTSYYHTNWGFCLSENQFKNLKDEIYEIEIDSELNPNGSMTYGESVLQGKTDNEIFLSTYICHPSMANNELSGPLVSAFVYKKLKELSERRYTYRFLYLPETIGAIYYLSVNGSHLKEKLIAGYVLTCLGDRGKYTYKRSRKGNSPADRAAELVLSQTEKEFISEDFFPTGSDERQYCSPGFNLPVGSLMRTRYGKYKEYHTSGDNKEFISFEALEKSAEKYLQIISVLENNFTFINNFPDCEPQLGKRGLYPAIGSKKDTAGIVEAMMWILNLSDGRHDLISISERSGLQFDKLAEASAKLLEKKIIKIAE